MTDREIEVNVSETRSRPPTRARVPVSLSEEKESIEEAVESVISSTQTLHEAVSGLDGVELLRKGEITLPMGSYEVVIESDGEVINSPVSGEEPPYQASRDIDIEIMTDVDPESVAEVVRSVLAIDGSIGTVEYQLDDEVKENVYQQAVAEAVTKARRRAQVAAEADGAELGSLRDVTIGDADMNSGSVGVKMNPTRWTAPSADPIDIISDSDDSLTSVLVEPTPKTVTADVRVVFDLVVDSP